MKGLRFAVAAAVMLSGQAPALEPWRMPPPDAPSVAEADAFSRHVVEQGRIWQGNSMVAAATTTTPEARHVPTGARCRFWYRTGEITYPFLNSDHVNCSTSRDWVNIQTGIDRRETPDQIAGNPRHVWSYLTAARGTARDIATAWGERTAQMEHGSFEVSQPLRWTSSRGRVVDYVVLRSRFPGGGPEGTRQERITRTAVAVIGDWIFSHSVGGPVHYATSLDQYGEDGFVKLLQSIDEAALIL
ncbi:MAG TPA: hypothetical protein VEW04_03735 [Allosphingosinicella sp.]|nr:hypothetical protein [Allosphingosinicella sp.]